MLNEIIIGRLKAARKNQELTQAELAKLVGLNRNAVSFYECGRTSPTLDTIEDIMTALGITPKELFKNL